MNTIKYEAIRPTQQNAESIQRMTLDTLVGGYPRPDTIADPGNSLFIARQISELAKKPERFVGAFVDGRLNGYIKFGDWSIADELPYAIPEEAQELKRLQAEGAIYTPQFKLGVFGLAASYDLVDDMGDEIVDHLLDRVTDMALGMQHAAVNVAFYNNDPGQPVAMKQGFKFTGRIHDPLRAAGVVKRLYSKPLDS